MSEETRIHVSIGRDLLDGIPTNDENSELRTDFGCIN